MTAAVVVAIVSLLRVAFSSKGGGPFKPDPRAAFGPWAVVAWVVLSPIAFALAIMVLAGQVYLIVPLAAVLSLLFPWLVARRVLVPLGWARAAYWLAYTSDCLFHVDRKGGAALAAAWALCRKGERDAETAEWVAEKLAGEQPLRGAGLFASALLLAERGDLAGARLVAEAVVDLHDEASVPEAKRLARSWLAADAARRGDWRFITDTPIAPWEADRSTWFLRGVALALLLEPDAPSRFGLWTRWILSPHRRATAPLLARAVDALDGAFIEPDEDPPAPPPPGAKDEADPLRAALSLHAHVLAGKAQSVRADDLRAVGEAWDLVLEDRAVEHRVRERALVIGASGSANALEDLREAVEEDLAALVSASGLSLESLGKGGVMTDRVRMRLRDALLTDIESATDGLKRRTEDKRALPAPDEWREWTTLRAEYERGVARAGQELRRLAFVKVHADLCGYAVWLYNDRRERPLANAVFRWLLAEATLLDDARAMALQQKNVDCGV